MPVPRTVTPTKPGDSLLILSTAQITGVTFPPGTQIFARDTGITYIANTSGAPIGSGGGAGIPNDASVTTAKIVDTSVTLAKLQNAVGNSKLLGSGAAGAGLPYSELSIGANLLMTGNVLSATGGGSSTPGGASGQIQFNDASAFNGDPGLLYDKTIATFYATNIVATTSLLMPDSTISTNKIANNAVTFAKIQNAGASSKLLGSGSSGSGTPYAELGLGTNLSIAGTTINASADGGIPADNSITTPKLFNSAVTGAKIADATITDAKLVPATLTAASIANNTVTLGKIALAANASRLVGSGSSGSGQSYTEIVLGTNLAMSAGTLNATGGNPGGVAGQVQFNQAGTAFGGDTGLIFDPITDKLTIKSATAPPVSQGVSLDVRADNGSGFAMSIFHDGNTTTSKGLLIQAGDDSPSVTPTTFLQFSRGDGTQNAVFTCIGTSLSIACGSLGIGADTTIAGALSVSGATTGATGSFTGAIHSDTDVTLNGTVKFLELAINGTNFIGLKAAASLGANVTFTLPSADGTTGQFLATDGAGTLFWGTASGGGGSATGQRFTANDAILPATDPAAPVNRNDHFLLAFNDTTVQGALFENVVPSDYATGSAQLLIDWVADTATTGDVIWGVEFEREQTGGGSLDANGFAARVDASAVSSPVNGVPNRSTITLSHAQLDNFVANDSYRFRITRRSDLGGDTLLGDAQLMRAAIVF